MAVSRQTGTTGINTSTSSTSIPFIVPNSGYIAGDLWLVSAVFRGGSTVTISGVPASFTLVKRTDSGSATTNATVVTYTYIATGLETSLSTFATITISIASKAVTYTDPWRGADTTTPIASVVSGIGTTSATTSSALPAVSSTSAVAVFIGAQGTSTLSPTPSGSTTGSMTATSSNSTAGGSAATNLTLSGGAIQATSVVSQTYTDTASTASTAVIHAFVIQAPIVPPMPPPRTVLQAVKRASLC